MPHNQTRTDEDLAFNAVIGKNIKYLRKLSMLNQTKVGNAINVSFQQIQKYERGKNCLSSLRLFQLAKKFKVSLDVLVDPEMITKYRGFSPDIDDKTKRKIEIAKEADRLTYREEFIKENADVSNKS